MNETHRRRGRELHQLVDQLGLARIVRNLGQFLEGRHLASARRGRRSASGGEGAHLRAQAQSGAISRNHGLCHEPSRSHQSNQVAIKEAHLGNEISHQGNQVAIKEAHLGN
jgi:hypothetical protein